MVNGVRDFKSIFIGLIFLTNFIQNILITIQNYILHTYTGTFLYPQIEFHVPCTYHEILKILDLRVSKLSLVVAVEDTVIMNYNAFNLLIFNS